MTRRICIFGASGATGQALSQQAVERGFDVVAFVRSEPAQLLSLQGIAVMKGSLTNPSDVERAITGCEAVICAFGPRPGSSDAFCAEATRNIVTAMKARDVQRLVCITGAMIGAYPHLSWFMRSMKSTYQKKQPDMAIDRIEQERLVETSGLAWTLVKPPRLSDGEARRQYRSGENLKVGAMSSINRLDLSRFILDQLDAKEYVGKRVVVQY